MLRRRTTLLHRSAGTGSVSMVSCPQPSYFTGRGALRVPWMATGSTGDAVVGKGLSVRAAADEIDKRQELRRAVLGYAILHSGGREVVPASTWRIASGLGWGQADLALCLLRINTRASLALTERLVGRKITRCPPQLREHQSPTRQPDQVREGDDRRIARVTRVSCPWRPSCSSAREWREFRVGRSVRQLLARGVKRRHVRRALRKGWIVLEGRR